MKDKFITNSANHEGKVPVDRCTGKFKKDARLFSRCVSCRTDKPRSAFSQAQLRKNATKRKCMSCVRTYTPQHKLNNKTKSATPLETASKQGNAAT